MCGVSGKSTLLSKTWWRPPKTVARHILICPRAPFSSKTWWRLFKPVAKRKFSLLAGNAFVKIASSCFHCAKNLCRWSKDSYLFAGAVAKRTFPHFGIHAAVGKLTFPFSWMNLLTGFVGLIVRDRSETQIF